MATQRSTNNTKPQPFDKAIGLLAACVMVVFGGWIALRPEIILLRALVVGCATNVLVRILIGVMNSAEAANDD